MSRKYRVILDLWLARAGTLVGWVWLVFWGLVGLVGFTQLGDKPGEGLVMAFICLGLAALNWLMIRASRKTRELVQDFRLYSAALAEDKSIVSLCEKLGKPHDEVTSRLQTMCRRGYIRGHIDLQQGYLKLNPTGEAYAARCPGCGATTGIYRSGDKCRYCGNPLEIRKEKDGD